LFRMRIKYVKVLALSWPIDLCGWETEAEVQGMLQTDLRNLVLNSLLDERKESENISYRIHPLVHSFLLHNRLNGYSTLKV